MMEAILDKIIALIGMFGPFGLLVAMVLQAIIAPIPSEMVLIFGGATFGLLIGTIFGGIGSCFGAIASFYISKKGGRPIVIKLLGKKNVNWADKWFKKWGGWAVLLGRLFPFIPFDAVSYGAGLTEISFSSFMTATIVGVFPRAIFYCYLGSVALKEVERTLLEKNFSIGLIIVGIAFLAIFLAKYFISKKK